MDHDDLLLPGALEETEKAFSDPTVDFAYSNTVNHDVRINSPVTWDQRFGWSYRNLKVGDKECVEAVSAEPFPQSISRIWFAPNHLRAWRASSYWKVGGHNATMKITDDHDLMCRTYIAGKMQHIDKPLYFYRVHGGNTWLAHQEEIQETMFRCHDKYIEPMMMKWAKELGLRCIDLCGGVNPAEGFESVDLANAQINTDLNERWPFEDNSVGVIRAHDAIEHLRNPIHTMNEAYRVLAHGGMFDILVPSTDGQGAFCDPTHVSFWNYRSFRYYTQGVFRKFIPSYVGRFQQIKLRDIRMWDDLPYVSAHLIALKDGPRYYGEVLI
jgi:SAM-dependent methyltransferase